MGIVVALIGVHLLVAVTGLAVDPLLAVDVPVTMGPPSARGRPPESG
jgi:hypothetical protein